MRCEVGVSSVTVRVSVFVFSNELFLIREAPQLDGDTHTERRVGLDGDRRILVHTKGSTYR